MEKKNIIVKNLTIMMIAIFTLQIAFPFETQYFMLYANSNFQLFQIITHMFMHGSIGHIFSNILAFVIFSKCVEGYLGNKFITLFILSGVVGCLFQIMQMYYFNSIDNPMIGASAAIFGTTMASILVEPDRVINLIIIEIRAKYFLGFFFIMELLSVFTQVQDNVGHVAHVFGGITGMLFILYVRSKSKSLNL